jgi:hypothetical protein
MSKLILALAPLALLAAGCSRDVTNPAQAEDAAPTRTPAIATGDACDAAYASPPRGLQVIYQGRDPGGRPANFGFRHALERATPDGVEVTETMLIGPQAEPGPRMPLSRKAGIITTRSGDAGAERTYVFGPLAEADIHALRPGQTVETPVTERSNFQPGGPGTASGRLKITFVGCALLPVGDLEEPVKVFDVVSAARAVSPPGAADPARDETVETRNRYWVSQRLGWPLRDETAEGAIVATELREP